MRPAIFPELHGSYTAPHTASALGRLPALVADQFVGDISHRALGDLHHALNLVGRDAERRSKAEDVAARHCPGDQPLLQAAIRDPCADGQAGVEARLAFLVGNELYGGQQANAPHLADHRVIVEFFMQAVVEKAAGFFCILDEAVIRYHVKVGKRGGRAERMSRVGVAV